MDTATSALIDNIASEAAWQADKWMDVSPEAITDWTGFNATEKSYVIDDALDGFIERYGDMFSADVFEQHRADIISAIVAKMS